MTVIFKDLGMRTVAGYKAFYYKHNKTGLKGMVLTHVDNYSMGRKTKFLDKLEEKVRKELNVSKVEKEKYQFMYGVVVEHYVIYYWNQKLL